MQTSADDSKFDQPKYHCYTFSCQLQFKRPPAIR